MLITSRSAAEYRAMFDLTDPLTGSILDCCAGGAGFTAEAGVAAVALDSVYAQGQAKLAEMVRTGQQGASAISYANAEHFDWSWYGTRERREELRADAAKRFLADVADRPDHYIAGDVHHLPFADNSFDLVLCSHLLFTWSDVFDEDWHRRAIGELLRVGRGEVRIFPTVVQKTGAPVPFLPGLLADFASRGVSARLVKVPFMFQVGADEMLVLSANR
jgi:SAM-dependent methyltransferase